MDIGCAFDKMGRFTRDTYAKNISAEIRSRDGASPKVKGHFTMQLDDFECHELIKNDFLKILHLDVIIISMDCPSKQPLLN
jgi:hypothetical protein